MRTTQLRKIRRLQLARHTRHLLARSVFEHLYQAITGSSLVPSAFFRRAVANGLPAEELSFAITSAKTAERLPDYLYTVCQQKLEQAVYWDDLGLKVRARDNYLESALWGIYSDLLSFDPARQQEICAEYRHSYAQAAPHFNSPAMAVNLEYQSQALEGYFRLPSDYVDMQELDLSIPCAVIFNELASPKEELHFTENSLLAAGIATLTFDYPGTGQYSGQTFHPFDLTELSNSIYYLLSSLPQVDTSRLVLYGIGFGARLGLELVTKFPDRFKCLASISAPLEILTDIDKLSELLSREQFISEVSARAALMDLGVANSFENDLALIEMPILVVGGGKDKISLPEETHYIYEHVSSSDKKLILCPAAHHNLYDMMPSLRYEIAQWIKQRV